MEKGVQDVVQHRPLPDDPDGASRDNKPYFVLRGANNEILGTSETYSGDIAREVGINSTKKNAPTALPDMRQHIEAVAFE